MLHAQMFRLDHGAHLVHGAVQLEIAVDDHIIEGTDTLQFLARSGDT